MRNLMLMVMCVMTIGCNRGETGKPVVALVVKTLNNAFFVEMERGARAAADSLGVELVVQAPEREIDVERQMQIIENLIERHVSVLAIVPNGSREIVPAILKANAAGIPVVTVDSRVDAATLRAAGGSVATFIGSDNRDGGRLAAQFVIISLGGKGDVVVLEGIPGHESTDSRLRGFRETLANAENVHIVASQTANSERDQGFTVMQNVLQSQPAVRAVFACNDAMALGAVEAIAAAGKTSQIVVVGFDAQDDARKAVAEGRMGTTVAQNPFAMGHDAVLSAMRLLRGEPVAAEQPIAITLVSREKLEPR